MKKHMKQFAAAVMAVAMLFSLSVTAFADNEPSVNQSTDVTNTVTSQGGKPTDVQTVVFPTAETGHFDLYFDSHGLIATTQAERYTGTASGWNATNTHNGNTVEVDSGNFFFKRITPTIFDETKELLTDVGDDSAPKAGHEVVVYKKLAASNATTSIFASYDADGVFKGWVERKNATDSQEPADAAWAKGDTTTNTPDGAYLKIAAIKGINPATGYGFDAIDKINEEYPDIYFRKVGKVDATRAGSSGLDCAALKDTVEYIFNIGYDDAAYYAVIPETPEPTEADPNPVEPTPNLIYTTLGVAPSTAPATPTGGSAAASDFEGVAEKTDTVKNAIITFTADDNSKTVYYRQRVSENVASLMRESDELKVINKTNAPIGVTAEVELTGITGGDGTKSGTTQSYVYAKAYDFDAGKFYDGKIGETTTKEIVGGMDGVPVIYMALQGKDKSGAVIESEVMSYASNKGSMTVATALAGNDGVFDTHWVPAPTNDDPLAGAYEYSLKSPETTREADFESFAFSIIGAIDADNDAWNDVGSPSLKITWKTEAVQRLAAPSLTAATWVTKKAWVFTSDKNANSATLKKVTVNFANDVTKTIEASDITYANNTKNKTETFTIPATWMSATGNTTKPESVVFTFYDAAKPFRTVDVTLTSY